MSRHEDMHGPTRRELRMIELDEAGWTVADIADEMNVGQEYVLERLKGLSMHDTQKDLRFWTGCRVGSKLLADRINQLHPVRA